MALHLRPLALVFAFISLSLTAEEIICPATRDVWLSSATKDEANSSSGKFHRMKLKIYQEFGLLDFDVSKLKGKSISSATLFIASDGGERFAPKERGSDLRWFMVSTVSSEWEEGLGASSYAIDEKGHGATFNEASYKTRPWTISGSKVWDVTLGNGNSLRCDVDAGDPKNGYFQIPLDKRLVEARIADASHGFLLMDGSTGVDRNSFVQSREGKKKPYLKVTVSAEKTAPPAAPTNLVVKPAANEATVDFGALEISLTVPDNTHTYQIKLNGKPLPRWQIPFAAKAGVTQTFSIRHLAPDADANLEVSALDAAGIASPIVTARAKTSSAISVPKLPNSNGPKQLHVARGEIISLPIPLTKEGKGIQVKVNGLDGIQHNVSRTWFVKSGDKWIPAFAIPVSEKLPINFPDQPGPSVGQVLVDLIIPPNAPVGPKAGSISITTGAETEKIELNLVIHAAVIPPEIHFNPELNAYDEPGGAGSEQFYDSHRLAHYYRCSLNSVPYSQRGDMHTGCAPKVSTDGHVTDWSAYDKNFGPLLDGSAFKDNPAPAFPCPCCICR